MKKKTLLKLTVRATGAAAPTTDCPKAKEFAVYRGENLLGYVVANTKAWAIELADTEYRYT